MLKDEHPRVATGPPQPSEWRLRAVRHAWRTKKNGCHDATLKKNNMKDKDKDQNKAKDRWHCVLKSPYELVFSKRNNRMRYRSQAKARFQVAMAALVHNLKRLVKPEIEHVPLKATC
ncbi:MAG: hypothetical protein QGE95_13895 [Arenicellales bacterium]|nr:hypothetical protein [Arenicellales bacterium]